MIQEENKEQGIDETHTSQKEQDQQTEYAKHTEEQQAPTSYAVRPEHRQRRLIDYNGRDKMFKVRNTLNILFMVLAIIGLILWTQTDLQTLSIVILLIGVAFKIAEVCLRLFKK